ncbi:MAG: creatininase family protein [Streptosporangiales bacterium]
MTAWQDLTSARLDLVDRQVPVVLPLAAVEQHGPHLPLATDRLIVEHLCARLDEELGAEVLTLPTVAVGNSTHHRDFPGTLSVRHATLLDQATDVAECVFGDGFHNLLLLNAHGGNEGIAQVALEQLGARWRDRRVVRTTWWQVAAEAIGAISEAGPGGVGHACELETSLVLAIAPQLVDTAAAPARESAPAFTWDAGDMLRPSRATLYRRFADIAPSGVFGEPRAASAEKGKRISEAVTTELVGILESLRGRPLPAAGGATA